MHVRTVVLASLELLALAMGGCVEDLGVEPDAVREIVDAEVDGEDDDHCHEQPGESACRAAGCRWQPIVGAMLESDNSCSFGEPLGLCFAESLAQPCEPEARRCADGRFAWVLPGPDDAVVLAYSESSCGVPEHFLPCPWTTAPDDLKADVETRPTGADDLDAVAATACVCACEDDA
jgi:hypothetical protein